MWMVGIFATSAAIRHVQTIQSTNFAASSAHNWMELQVETSDFKQTWRSGGVLVALRFEEVRNGLEQCPSGRLRIALPSETTEKRERVPHLPNSPRRQGQAFIPQPAVEAFDI